MTVGGRSGRGRTLRRRLRDRDRGTGRQEATLTAVRGPDGARPGVDGAFGALGLPRVISVTEPPNRRSLAVMRRLGMVFDHQAEVEEDGAAFQAVVYAITKARWRSRAERHSL
jgi:hypothetical protein